MGYPFFDLEKRGNYAILWLNHPETRNLMTWDFWEDLPRVMAQIAADEDIRCLIIAGRGKSFSLGLDIASMAEKFPFLQDDSGAEKRMELKALIETMQKSMFSVENLPIPVIAAVHRHCLGGGLDLACACDIRLASKDAQFSVFEVKVGIVADMGSIQKLPFLIGEGLARQMAFTGDMISGEKAESIGLANECFADQATLMTAAFTMAEKIASNPPFVVRGIKEVMNRGRDLTYRQRMDYISVWNSAFLHSDEFRNIVRQRLKDVSRSPR